MKAPLIIRRWLARRRMPKQVKDWWYCGEWNGHQYEEMKAGRPYEMPGSSAPEEKWLQLPPYEGLFMFTPGQLLDQDSFAHREVPGMGPDYDPGGDGLNLVPAIKVGEFVGWYRCVRRGGKSHWYDGASWDDGYKADLELVKVTGLEALPK